MENKEEFKEVHYIWKSSQIRLTSKLNDRIAKEVSIKMEVSQFIQPAYVQFVFCRNQSTFNKALQSANADLTKTTEDFTIEVQCFDVLMVSAVNSLVHYMTKFDSKSIQVPEEIAKEVQKSVQQYDELLFLWERDHSMVWVTGERDVIGKKFPAIVSCIDDRKIRLERAQVHLASKAEGNSFFQEEKYKESATAIPPSSPSSSLGQTLYSGSVSEDCCICMDKCTNPKRLACGHIFCKECIDMQFTYKPICPACGKVFGKLTGNQPNGTITFRRHAISLPGYSHDGIIEVMYNIYSGTQGDEHPNPGRLFEGIRRSGLLPDNEEGRKVAKLLNVAFSRKLVFTIGRSRITEKEGVVIWNNIGHKTRREGGRERFGYPDPDYISRVLDELSVKGVTEESADDPNEFKEYSSVFSRR